jgi:hypothetical protein
MADALRRGPMEHLPERCGRAAAVIVVDVIDLGVAPRVRAIGAGRDVAG